MKKRVIYLNGFSKAFAMTGFRLGWACGPAKVIAAMTKITVAGVTGTMTWDASGEPVKGATAVVITNGAYVAFGA